jgi:hypothetical protein
MKAQSVRVGHKVGKREIVWAVTGTATFAVGKSTYLAAARLVELDNGKRMAFELGTDVNVRGWAEPLPAGGVESKHVKTPSKVKASDGRWPGESVHGMSTREHDLIARTNMFDAGRVNGTVGASRNGVGSAGLTGPSF